MPLRCYSCSQENCGYQQCSCSCHGERARSNYVVQQTPEWLVPGAKVCLPGGPPWTVAHADSKEVGLIYAGDDQPVVWGIEKFLPLWGPFLATRFDREDPV